LRSVLRIGGIAFEVASSRPFDDTRTPAYADFLRREAEEDEPRIAVELEPGEARVPKDAALTFDTGTSWLSYALEGGDRVIALALATARDRPLLTARFDPEVARVQITWSPDFLVEGRLTNPICYPLDQLLMVQRLAREGGAIVHCALIDVGDGAVICPGVSGAGKTTLTRQLVHDAGLRVLSDDRAVIRPTAGGHKAWGTPWPGEGGYAVNRGLPLLGIGFIEHRETPMTEPISRSEAIHRLVQVASVPWFDREAGPRVFDGLAELCDRVPVWRMGVPAHPSAALAVRALAEGRALQADAPKTGSAV
jgi:hypothetical protein